LSLWRRHRSRRTRPLIAFSKAAAGNVGASWTASLAARCLSRAFFLAAVGPALCWRRDAFLMQSAPVSKRPCGNQGAATSANGRASAFWQLARRPPLPATDGSTDRIPRALSSRASHRCRYALPPPAGSERSLQ